MLRQQHIFLIRPNPIEIHGAQKGKGLDFVVSLMNIWIIKSDRRDKTIYLKEAIIPKDGGYKSATIVTNDNKRNFDNLLFSIRKSAHHLI